MKKLILFLFCSIPILAQGTPNCSQALTFTTAVPGPAINTTAGAAAGCAGWRLTWQVSGSISAARIQLEGSQDNSTWAVFAGSLIIEGSNPTNWTSATVSNTIVVRASLPYVRVNIFSITNPPGTIKTVLLGYSGTSAQNDTGAGSTPGGPAGGDLSGTYPDPSVVKVNGGAVPSGAGMVGTNAGRQLIDNSTAGGDLSGTYPSPDVVGVNGAAVPANIPCAGTNASGQIISQPCGSSLLYYFSDTASDISTYLQQTPAPYSPKTTLTFTALPNGTDTLQNWATNAGVPGVTFFPAGVYQCHLHALKSPFGVANLQCQFVEVSSVGVDIAVIGVSEQSNSIAQTETEYTLDFADANVYTLANSNSRIVARVQAVVTSGAPNVEIFVGGTADSHIQLPTNGGGSPSTPAFSTITPGTNTNGLMSVGTGSTLTPLGSGVVNANELNGGTAPVSASCTGTNGSGQLIAVACGGGASLSPPLFSSVNATGSGPSDSNVETTLIPTVVIGSQTIAANTFGNGTQMNFDIDGLYTTPAVSTDTLRVKMYCGVTVLADTGAISIQNIIGLSMTNQPWGARLQVGATSAGFLVNGSVFFSTSDATGTVKGAVTNFPLVNTAVVAYTLSNTCAFDFKATFSAATSGEAILGTNAKAYIPGNNVTPTGPAGTQTYYINASTGSDSNTCLASGTACLTLAHVLTLVPSTVPQNVTINVADGTYAEAVNIQGFAPAQQINIVGDTTTPANVIFSGNVSCVADDAAYTTDVCNVGGFLSLAGATITGTATRGIFTTGKAKTILNAVVVSGTTTYGLETSLTSSLELAGNLTVSGFSAAGLYGNQKSYTAVYAGTLTITGAGSGGTTVGILLKGNASVDMHGSSEGLAISAVQYGVYIVEHSQFTSGNGNTTAFTITNGSVSSSVAGVYAGELSLWDVNPGSLTVTKFGTCLLADGNALIVQRNYTNTSCSTSTGVSQQAQIITF